MQVVLVPVPAWEAVLENTVSVIRKKHFYYCNREAKSYTWMCGSFFLYYCFFWKAILCEKSYYFRPFSSLPAQDSVDFTTVNMFSVLDLLQMETMVKSVYFNLAPILRCHSNHWHCFSSTGYGRMSYEPQPAVMGPEAPGNYGIK